MTESTSMNLETRFVLEVEGILNNPQDCPSSRLRAEKIVKAAQMFFLEGPEKYVFFKSKPWPHLDWAPTQAELDDAEVVHSNYTDLDF